MSSTIEALEKDVEACVDVGDRPLLVSEPGAGKTAFVHNLFRKKGMRVITLIGSLMDPTDMNGFPVLMKETIKDASGLERALTELAARRWMYDANYGKNGTAVFLDELSCAPLGVQAAMLTFVLSLQAGEFQLDPDLVAVIAGMNPAEIATNGTELSPAMANRFTWFDFPCGAAVASDWATNFVGYWGNPRPVGFMGSYLKEDDLVPARAAVAGYVRAKPDALHAMPKDAARQGQGGWPSARAWERVSWHLALCRRAGEHPVSAARRIAGCIGPEHAEAFLTYLRKADLPDPETYLREDNPAQFSPSGQIDVDFAVVSSVAEALMGHARAVTDQRVLRAVKVFVGATQDKAGSGTPAYEAALLGLRRITPLLGAADRNAKGKTDPRLVDYLKGDRKAIANFMTELQKVGGALTSTLEAAMGIKLK